MASASLSARAIVSAAPGTNHQFGDNWSIKDVHVRSIKDDEVLVQIIATGICHTDLLMTSLPPGMAGIEYPRIAGHEGAGYVRAVGSKVTKKLDVGDPVLLSFSFCNECTQCKQGHPAYCLNFHASNMVGDATCFKVADGSGEAVGQFFGQSSFANLSVVKGTSILNVKEIIKDEEELKLFAPLGCGVQTGAGTVVRLSNATKEDTLVIMGLGGVGLSAIMVS